MCTAQCVHPAVVQPKHVFRSVRRSILLESPSVLTTLGSDIRQQSFTKNMFTYAILFMVVTEDGKSSVLSELCRLHNYLIVNSLQHDHCLCITWTNLSSQHTQSTTAAAATATTITTSTTTTMTLQLLLKVKG